MHCTYGDGVFARRYPIENNGRPIWGITTPTGWPVYYDARVRNRSGRTHDIDSKRTCLMGRLWILDMDYAGLTWPKNHPTNTKEIRSVGRIDNVPPCEKSIEANGTSRIRCQNLGPAGPIQSYLCVGLHVTIAKNDY